MRALSIPLLLLAPAIPAAAQDSPLTITGSTRARVETFDGQPRAGADPADTVLLLRTELSAEYDAGVIAVGGELIDSRAYFADRGTPISTSEVNALEPSQAWIRFDLAHGATAKLGRFHLDLGSRRLVSRNGYRNTVNSFTGARLDLPTGEKATATLFWTMPQDRRPADAEDIRDNAVALDRERDETQLFGAFLQGQPSMIGRIDLYALGFVERDAPALQTRDRRLATLGGRLWRAPARGRPDYEVEAAWQTGRARGSTAPADRVDRRVAAGFVHVAAGYTLATRWSPRIMVAADYASGGAVGRFDTLYGSRTFDFGPTSLYGPVSRANLVSPAVRVEIRPERWQAHAEVRPLWLAGRTDSFGTTGVRDPSGASGRFAGVQYDARAQYWITPDRVRAGLWLAWLDKGRFLHNAPNAPRNGDALYAATEITVGF